MLLAMKVSDAHIPGVIRTMRIRSYAREDVLIPGGIKPDAWHMIITGMVSATVPSENGRLPINIFGSYAWFGEQSILSNSASYLEYSCVTEVQLLSIPAQNLLDLSALDVGFSEHLTRLVAWRAQRYSEMLVLMKLGNTATRLVVGLAQFAEALVSRSSRPATDGINGGVLMPVKQEFVARLCGLSRTMFSAYIQQLESHGWIRIHYGNLELLSIEIWRRVARRLGSQSFSLVKLDMEGLLNEFALAAQERNGF